MKMALNEWVHHIPDYPTTWRYWPMPVLQTHHSAAVAAATSALMSVRGQVFHTLTTLHFWPWVKQLEALWCYADSWWGRFWRPAPARGSLQPLQWWTSGRPVTRGWGWSDRLGWDHCICWHLSPSTFVYPWKQESIIINYYLIKSE